MKKIVFALISFVLLRSIYAVPVSAQDMPVSSASANERGRISVALKPSIQIDDFIKTLQDKSFDMVSVQGSFTANGKTI